MVCVLWLGACASTPPADSGEASPAPSAKSESISDPLEGFNRGVFTFNRYFDDYFMAPVARGYRWILPRVVRDRVSSFFNNLFEPMNAINNLLQGKPYDALTDTGRLLTNSTIGILGFWDVATPLGLPKHEEDFGQTLAVWGVGEGPYLVLPILGPSNFRDGPAKIVNWFTLPQTYVDNSAAMWALYGVELIDLRARLLDATDILDQAAGSDRYVFTRESFTQRRRYLVNDGRPPAGKPDSILFEDDAPGSPPKSAPATQ